MFFEPYRPQEGQQTPNQGWVEVICGCMFSGKTEELIRRMRRAIIAKQQVQIFKPKLDNRYHLENVVSHNQNSIRSTPVDNPKEIIFQSVGCSVVGIDEAQFFNEDIIEVIQHLAKHGKRVIVAGLDMDFAGEPFGPMPKLLAMAEFVTKVHAICARCGSLANYSYRLVKAQDQVLIGETDAYEARCRYCFTTAMEEHNQ